MSDPAPVVDIPSDFVRLKYPLPHLVRALVGEAPVRIVAMGSSSTAGRADVVPYPHRLEMYLRDQFGEGRYPNLRIDVLNRGRGGEEAQIAKICRSFVSEMQNRRAIAACLSIRAWNTIMRNLPDHGLPLVQLKEQRRDLVVALQNRIGPVSGWELMQIAAVQQAISAFEDVIADLDAELEAAA